MRREKTEILRTAHWRHFKRKKLNKMSKCVVKNKQIQKHTEHFYPLSSSSILRVLPPPFFGSRWSLRLFSFPDLSSQFTHAWKKKKKKLSVRLPVSQNEPTLGESDLQTDLKLALIPSAWWVSPTRLVALHGFSSVLLQLSGPESKSGSAGGETASDYCISK